MYVKFRRPDTAHCCAFQNPLAIVQAPMIPIPLAAPEHVLLVHRSPKVAGKAVFHARRHLMQLAAEKPRKKLQGPLANQCRASRNLISPGVSRHYNDDFENDANVCVRPEMLR
ncbi:hypothetical protein DPSP01_003379 [Paraphaeosphaeria sporulosa]